MVTSGRIGLVSSSQDEPSSRSKRLVRSQVLSSKRYSSLSCTRGSSLASSCICTMILADLALHNFSLQTLAGPCGDVFFSQMTPRHWCHSGTRQAGRARMGTGRLRAGNSQDGCRVMFCSNLSCPTIWVRDHLRLYCGTIAFCG